MGDERTINLLSEFNDSLEIICPSKNFPVLNKMIMDHFQEPWTHHLELFQEHCVMVAKEFAKRNTSSLLNFIFLSKPISYWIGFLHDIGKILAIDCKGRTHAHAAISEYLAKKLFKFHGMPSEFTSFAVKFIGLHMCCARCPPSDMWFASASIIQLVTDENDRKILNELQEADVAGKKSSVEYEPGVGYNTLPKLPMQRKSQVAIFLAGPRNSGKTHVANSLLSRLRIFEPFYISRDNLLIELYGKIGESYDECWKRVYGNSALKKKWNARWQVELNNISRSKHRVVIIESVLFFFWSDLSVFSEWFTVTKVCVPLALTDGGLVNWPHKDEWYGLQPSRFEKSFGLVMSDMTFGDLKNLVSCVVNFFKQNYQHQCFDEIPRMDVICNKSLYSDYRDSYLIGLQSILLKEFNIREERLILFSYIDRKKILHGITRRCRGSIVKKFGNKYMSVRESLPVMNNVDLGKLAQEYQVDKDTNFIVTPKYDGTLFIVLLVRKVHPLYPFFNQLKCSHNVGILVDNGILFVGTIKKLEATKIFLDHFIACGSFEFGSSHSMSAVIDRILTINQNAIDGMDNDDLIAFYYEGIIVTSENIGIQIIPKKPKLQFLGYSTWNQHSIGVKFHLPRPDVLEQRHFTNAADADKYMCRAYENFLKDGENEAPEGFVVYAFKNKIMHDIYKIKMPIYFHAKNRILNELISLPKYAIDRFFTAREMLHDFELLKIMRSELEGLIYQDGLEKMKKSNLNLYLYKSPTILQMNDDYAKLCSKYSVKGNFLPLLHKLADKPTNDVLSMIFSHFDFK